MDRAFERAPMLGLIGVLLFVGPLVLIEPGQSTYYVEAQAIDTVPDDTEPVQLTEINASMRDEIREAIEQSDGVDVGHQSPYLLPEYVRYDGAVYDLSTLVADPGGGGAIIGLASFGLGVLAFAGGAAYSLKGAWRRYRR